VGALRGVSTSGAETSTSGLAPSLAAVFRADDDSPAGAIVRTERLPQIVIATAALWLFALVLLTGVSLSEGVEHMLDTLPLRAVMCVEGAGVCVLIVVVLRRLSARTPRLQFLCAGALVVAAALQSGLADDFAEQVMRHPRISPTAALSDAIGDAAFMVWIYLAWAGIYFALVLTRRLHAQELRSAQAAAATLQAQNSMLRYQINPHFLFNSLNAVATLIMDRKNDLAEQVVLSVSGFLRFSLEHGLQEKVTLRREIEAQYLYLSIERVRFGERFVFAAEIPDRLAGALVPSLILQPLVENAVKYAVAPTTALARVTIVAAEAMGRLQISVEDTGQGLPPTAAVGLGVGLSNVRARLAALYGAAGELHCEQLRPHGFRARLTLPLEFP
jgi:two-component system LytT family sensor kinase